jgi:hypothetical protein
MAQPTVPANLKSPVVAAEHHLNPVHLWAAGINTPLRCLEDDARLEEGERSADQTYGQNNWQVALEFRNFANLAEQLGGDGFSLPRFARGGSEFIEEIQIARLGILAHGAPGAVDIDGAAGTNLEAGATDLTLMNQLTLPRYAADFSKIERVLQPRAKVFFMCCLTGAGAVGEEFLKAVSLLWAEKEIMVFGFRTVLYQSINQKKRDGSGSCYPGARETHYDTLKPQGTNMVRYYETLDAWNNLSVLPWASERSPHNVMAYKGVIVNQGAPGNFAGAPPLAP